jgi:N-ethylmaleimide reductase
MTGKTTMKLFSPVAFGPFQLAHRVVLAPMTRLRADPDDSPSAMMVTYYQQRASQGGPMITESAHPSYDSRGYIGAPGIYTDRHVDAWKNVTDAVHARDARIFMQIAHDGRQSHVDLSWGKAPIAPSVVPYETTVCTQDGWVPNSPHRALELHEIPALVESFRRAAERARDAGFDGVELHGANGYWSISHAVTASFRMRLAT